MKYLVQFPLNDGTSAVVEVNELEGGETVHAGRRDLIVKAKETLEEALERVIPTTRVVLQKVRQMGEKPAAIDVTFGIKLTVEAGAVIASAGGEANFEVTFHWEKPANEAVKGA